MGTRMGKLKYILIFTLILGVVIGAYNLGRRSNTGIGHENRLSAPRNLEEVAKIETEFERQQVELTNKVAEWKNQIATTKQNLELSAEDRKFDSVEIEQRLQELDEEMTASQDKEPFSGVPIPVDSPDGKIIHQARSESGIPLSVLENYEKEDKSLQLC